jgi:predicted enzyme related to lactoylglutathione lyase
MGNPIVHWELMVGDMQKAKAFYTKVFDWTIDDSGMPGYGMISTGSDPGGGMMAKPEMAPAPSLNTYFAVEDIEATLAKATAAGATLLVPKTPVPGVGSWAMFADPDGIPIGIFQMT